MQASLFDSLELQFGPSSKRTEARARVSVMLAKPTHTWLVHNGLLGIISVARLTEMTVDIQILVFCTEVWVRTHSG